MMNKWILAILLLPQIALGAISSGTFIIDGVGDGDHYALPSEAIADTGDLSGDLIFDVQTSVTDNGQCVYGGKLNGHTLKLYSSENYRHNGYAASGSSITVRENSGAYIYLACEGAGIVDVSYLNILSGGKYTPANGNHLIHVNNVDTGFTLNLHHNIIRPIYVDGGGNYALNLIDDSVLYRVYNNVLIGSNGESTACTSIATKSVFENNTVFNTHTGFAVTGDALFRNNIVIVSSRSFTGISMSTGTNNCISDAQNSYFYSESESLINKTYTSIFLSTGTLDATSLFLKSDSDCLDTGTTAIYSTLDIRGVSRPQNSIMDIGAYEIEQTTGEGVLDIQVITVSKILNRKRIFWVN